MSENFGEFEPPADPTDTSSAIDYILWASSALEFKDGSIESVNWNAVDAAIETGLDKLQLTFNQLQGALLAVRDCPSPEIRSHVEDTLQSWASANGTSAVPGILDIALAKFDEPFHFGFDYFAEAWPFLLTDRQLIDAAITRVPPKRNGSFIKRVRSLRGTSDHARELHRRWLFAERSLTVDRELAEIFYDWTEGSVWGQLQYRLWLPSDAVSDGSRPVRPDIIALANELRQLPMDGAGIGADLDLLAMSPQSRATWRRTLLHYVDGDRELLTAVLEAVLWLTQDRADGFCLFTVLELLPGSQLHELQAFTEHPTHVVRLRAKAALELAAGSEDAHDLVLRVGRHYRAGGEPKISKTWIGDPRVEAALEAAFSRAATALADEMRSTVDSGEETHVAILFERLRSEAHAATRDLARIASEAGNTERIAVSFERRIVGRAEEGKNWLLPGRSFSTDICLILSARRDGKSFAERATFLQAKRLTCNGSKEYYNVDLSQVSDISEHTPASFLLLVGPATCGVAMPVVPARLVVEWFDASRGQRRVPPEVAARLGRGLAPWLVSEVVGLWTGDYRKTAVEKAQGTEKGRPTTVFELIVDAIPMSPDDVS